MPVVHRFDPPERFVAGTVGEPGQRTFFLQAREGTRLVSVSLEKQQVQALAERIDELLDELMRAAGDELLIPAIAPRDLADAQPLEQPIEEEFRAGTMTLSWDGTDELPSPIVVTSWNWLLELDSADTGAIEAFAGEHYGIAPEPNGGPGPPAG